MFDADHQFSSFCFGVAIILTSPHELLSISFDIRISIQQDRCLQEAGLEISYFMHWSENCIIAKAVPGSILDNWELPSFRRGKALVLTRMVVGLTSAQKTEKRAQLRLVLELVGALACTCFKDNFPHDGP